MKIKFKVIMLTCLALLNIEEVFSKGKTYEDIEDLVK